MRASRRLALHLIARPTVQVEQFAPAHPRSPAAVERHHHHLLGDDVPARVAALEVARQPGFLLGADHVRVGRGHVRAGDPIAVAARLVGAELAGVEEVERGEIAEAGAAIQLDAPSRWAIAPAHRHMLVPGLERGCRRKRKTSAAASVVIVDVSRPIVADLMIVEGHEEGVGGVGALQIGVGFVLGVAAAIVVEST